MWGLDTHPTLLVAITASEDRTLRCWSLDERRLIGSCNLHKGARSVAFHPSGRLIAVGFMDGKTYL